MLSPRARGPRHPTCILPIRAGSQGAAQHRLLEPRGDDAHPASDPHRCNSQADVHLTISATLQAVWNCEGLWLSSTLRSKMLLDKAFSYPLTYGT